MNEHIPAEAKVCKFCEMPIAPGEERESAMGGYGHVRESRCMLALKKEIERLNALINTPHTHDFLEAVKLEMPHQRERWGAKHDAGKTPADWFWLVGYLAGKALHALMTGKMEKAEHHIITTAAALGNWFLAITGESTQMRPGIDTPKGEQ
jgi:hypothetical protein